VVNLSESARALLARQDGVIERQQAITQGVSQSQIRTRLQRGDWVRLHPGVFHSVEHELTTSAQIRAAVLWAGPRSYLSGAAAAWWWKLTDVAPATIRVITPRSSHLRSRPGVTVTRRALPFQDRTHCSALPVTGRALTALYGAVDLGRAGPAMLDRALQRSVTFAAVRQAHYRNLGCHGSRAAGQLLQIAADGSAAVSERLLIAALKAAGIRGWRVNHPLDLGTSTVVPDLTFVAERVLIEVDGWAWHSSPDRFLRDRQRQNALVEAGWTVLRFTWFDLTDRLGEVLDQIRRMLRR
jgi:very-short-patch-repair endonuclease